jgi:dTDP-4-dehydrorhamnose reductase
MSAEKNILVLGASGMLGNAVFRFFSIKPQFNVFGTIRSLGATTLLLKHSLNGLISGIDVEGDENVIQAFEIAQPDIVINCIGLVKQLAVANEPYSAISINAFLPHRLARLCKVFGSRLIHMSTDCVFSGDRGMYSENDESDATDLYGRSKYLGEVNYPWGITLRTSIIGHELSGSHSLLNWFLNQQDSVSGYRRAIFSGMPTVEVARIIHDYVIPNPHLHGVYNLAASPISKYELLKLVSNTYNKDIDIIPDDSVAINRSLNGSRFNQATGFSPKSWSTLVREMREFG